MKKNLRNLVILMLMRVMIVSIWLAIAFCTEAQDTNPIISGLVINQKSEPLPGVSILIQGTKAGTTTDSAGRFTIIVPQKSAKPVIEISFVGYQTQRIKIGAEKFLQVKMAESTGGLNEVVVVGYGTQKKINVTGSVVTVSAKKIEDVAVGNISNALVGRLPGLIAVNRGGQPGSDASQISIRGFDNMLTIVDGVPNDFNNIDPNEIESITILKDASAAIYGARAGNGVLLVTTKHGKRGAPTISLNAYYGLQTPTRIAHQVDAATFATMSNAAQLAVGGTPLYSDADIQKYKTGNDPLYPNTNWYNQVFNKWAPISSYNLNTSGGTEQLKYFISTGYLDQEGLLKSHDIYFKRFNVRSNIDAKISKNISISFDLSGRIENRNQPGGTVQQILEDLTFSQPIYRPTYPDPTKLAYTGHLATQPIGRSNSDFSGYTNEQSKYFNGIVSLKYDIPFISGLSAKALYSYNTYTDFTKAFGKQFFIYNYDPAGNVYSVAGVGQNSKDQLDETQRNGTATTTQLSLNYSKTFGKHEISFLAVGEFIQSDSNYFTAHREGFLTTTIDQLFAGSDLNKDNYGSASADGRIGYAGRLNYSFAGKYLAEITTRYDASARYIASKRWGVFPGVSAGWLISKENFMRDVSFVNNLKLRASYGKAGNDYVGQFNFLTGYNFGGNNVFGESPLINKGIVSKGLANPDLTWETTTTGNVGVDGIFWKGFLNFSIDVFYRKVSNVAGYRYQSLPTTFGATLPLENINSFNDRGFELVLGHEQKINDFKLTFQGNLTYTRSKWIHYDEPVYPDQATRDRLQLSGQWKNRFFGYKALGLFQSQDEINKWPVIQDGNGNTTLKPGDIKYADNNGDGVLDYKDMHVIGRGFTPQIFFDLNIDLQYKGFDLSMLWQGAADNNAYFSGAVTQPFLNGNVPFSYLQDYWTPQNPNAKYPRVYPGGAYNNTFVSTFWLQNANYIRLKNIQIGYTLPKSSLSGLGIASCRIYVAAYNILTFDKVTPYDPETGTTGNGQFYPQQKSLNAGIKLSF